MYNDEQLVRQCLQGDKQQFSLLVDRYKKPITTFIAGLIRDREEANDLAQTAFLKAYENLWRYNPTYPFSTWLFQIAKNTSLDYLKKKKPSRLEDVDWTDQQDARGGPEQELVEKENRRELTNALAQLPPHLKIPLVLYHMNGLPYQQIADILGLPLSTVKNQMFQARKKMRQLLLERRT